MTQESKQVPTTSNTTTLIALGAVCMPLLAWVCSALGHRYIVLVGLAELLIFAAVANFTPANPNFFLSSGRTPAQRVSRQLILKKKGGYGGSYWCDPSIAFAALSDFSYTQGPEVDLATLLKEKGDVIAPYCIDDETRTVVFVETADLDPAETGPFFFQSQRDNAIGVYTVPFEEYHRVVDSLDKDMTDTSHLMLVYNVSRCGSTLLSKCLDNLTNVRSISEPDVMTSITHLASEAKGTRDVELVALTRSSAKLLCYLRKRKYPDCQRVCIKFRFQMVYVADLVHRALPESKAIFLYRNALDVIDSMGAAFINTGAYRLIRKIGLDIFYVFHVSTLPKHLPKLMPLMLDTARFPQSSYRALGAVCPFVMSWMSVMHFGMDAYRRGFVHAMLRYEDLVENKTEIVAKMCEQIKFFEAKPFEASQENVFNKDAHAATTTASRRTVFDEKTGERTRKGFAYLRGDDEAHIISVLARHEEIERSDFIIPGTLSM